MDIILLIISIVCILCSFIGCFAPALPGPPLAYIGLLIMHFTDYAHFSWLTLTLWALLAIFTVVADYVVPIIGSKLSGGGNWGNYGTLIGTIIGLFFLPFGLILGPFAGAFVGEKLGGADTKVALKSALGALIGFIAGSLLKLIICIYFLIEFLVVIFQMI